MSKVDKANAWFQALSFKKKLAIAFLTSAVLSLIAMDVLMAVTITNFAAEDLEIATFDN